MREGRFQEQIVPIVVREGKEEMVFDTDEHPRPNTTLEALGLEILAKVVDSAVAGVGPNLMGIGPVPAIRKVLSRTVWKLDDIDLIEINEAFAAQVLACDRELHFDPAKLNGNGGAIAHGHPITVLFERE